MDGVITISIQEFEELKAKAAKTDERNKKSLERLNKYNETNPNAVRERVKRYKDKDRDAYNARRRELRRLKKEAEAAASENPPVDGVTIPR